MLETKPSSGISDKAKQELAIVGATMLIMTLIAGVLIGYYFFEAHIVGRLNSQFEAMGMGLCNISPTYIQTNDNAWLTYFEKNQTPFIE